MIYPSSRAARAATIKPDAIAEYCEYAYDCDARLPIPIDVSITMWLEWFDNYDGYWDADAAEYRRCDT